MAQQHLKPSLLSTAVAAGLAATTMPAHALSLGISGQFNKVIGWIDNGANDAIGVFDNINSGTRFRFTGQEDIGSNLKVGGVWEWQWSNSPSSRASFSTTGEFSQTTATLSDRKAELYFAGGWGKVSLGKGDGAANGTAEVDLSGTFAIDYSGGNQCLLGAMTFGSAGPTVGTVYSQFDAESRNNRIRYDTPKLAKVFTVSASIANSKHSELAFRYAQTIGSTKVAVALGLSDTSDTAGTLDRKRTAISGSAILKNGLNFTLSFSTQETPTDPSDDSLVYGKIGWKKGKNAVAISLGQSKDRGTAGDSTSLAVTYNYTPAKGVEVYAGLRSNELDTCGAGCDDITAVYVGSRIKWK